MKHKPSFSVLLAILLTSCAIEGGVAPTDEPVAPPTAPLATAAPTAAQPSAEPTASQETGLRIGLSDAPSDLLPYHNDASDERVTAPISELLFPAPLLALGYTYTTTGVLEQVPSFENGDISVNSVQLYLDNSGFITTTVTEAVTDVEQISVTFRWNRNLRWSDGTPLTAADSVFAYELARQVSLGQEADSRMALLERYEQVDEYTTRAVLQPNITDPGYLTSYWTPLPRHLLADIAPLELSASDFALSPVGYGPYQVERRDLSRTRLERNPYYFNAPPAVESVTFVFRDDDPATLASAVAGGSLDLALIVQPDPALFGALKAEAAGGKVELSSTADPIWEHLDFNLDLPLLQDIRVRRAIAHAIDRPAMAEQLLGGFGSVLESWVMPAQWAAAPLDQITRYPFDPETAKRLLDEMGFADSDGDGIREREGQPLTLRLLTTANTALHQAAADQISADLAAVGVAIEIERLPSDELYSPDGPLFRREFDLALFAWIATPDPRGWERWSCAGVPNEANGYTGNNFPGWCFFEADQAIRTATTVLGRDERAAAYLRQQQLFTQELPLVPLFQRVSIAVSSPTLSGLALDETAPFTWNLARWRRK
jgi:peptide/nickel transport system substrate-binding protein